MMFDVFLHPSSKVDVDYPTLLRSTRSVWRTARAATVAVTRSGVPCANTTAHRNERVGYLTLLSEQHSRRTTDETNCALCRRREHNTLRSLRVVLCAVV